MRSRWFRSLGLGTRRAAVRPLLAREEAGERRHRDVIERSREVIFETDAQGRWSFLNPAWVDLTGRPVAASLGTSFLSVIHPQDRQATLDQLAAVNAGAVDEGRLEVRFVRADGSLRWAAVRCRLLGDAEAVGGYSGTLHDVTEAREAQQALLEREAAYRLLAENSGDMIVRIGLDGIRRYVSPASRPLLGYSPEEMVGVAPVAAIHPDDRARVVEVCESLLTGADEPICSYRQQHRDGHWVWLEAAYKLVRDAGGQPIEFIASVRDVGRRQSAERVAAETAARLQESHRLFAMAASIAGVGHWRTDLVRNEVLWSDEVYRIYGYDRDFEPTPSASVEAFHPDDRAYVDEASRRVRADGTPFDFQKRLLRPDGACRIVAVRGQAEMSHDGRVIGILGVIQDVTDRVEAEARYRLLADNVSDIIVRLDLDDRCTYASPSMHEVTGFRPDEAVGADLIGLMHRDDRETMRARNDELRRGNVGGIVIEYRTRHKDGRWLWLEARSRLVRDSAGAPAEIVSVIRDVSARKASEAAVAESETKYRLLADNATDVVLRTGRVDGEVVYVSPSCRDLAGYEPLDLVGRRSAEFIHPDDLATVHAAHVSIVGGASEAETVEYRLRHKNGEWVWLESHMKAWKSDDGADGVMSAIRDIGRRKALEAELRGARDRAEAGARAKSDFLATMSHEIRTPMTGVLGMIELLRADPEAAERERFFDSLEQSAKTLMAVLDDVLDFSKIESGGLTLEDVDFDLTALLRALADLYRNAASAKGLRLDLGTVDPARSVARGDPTRLRQILSNFIGNAIKFTAAGGITLAVTPAADDRWRFAVTDTGIGIDADAQARLFTAFTQADASTTRRYGGTGLGLSICKRLVEAMGGEIGIDSRPGEGSTFWFEVPLAAGDPVAIEREKTPIHPTGDVAPLRVLVAEDNIINQLLITGLLRRMGHAVVCVENGRLAVAAALTGDHDVVLMDMQMPEMDGIEATRAIRAAGGVGATLPIMALTADALIERRDRYADIGLTDFLTKPVDAARLARALAGIAAAPIAPPERSAPAEAIVVLDIERIASLRDDLGSEMVDRLLMMLRNDTPKRAAVIDDALDRGDFDAAARSAHALRGAASTIGAPRLADIAERIEYGATEDNRGALRVDLDAVVAETYAALNDLTPA